MSGYARRHPRELSGGQQQWVVLARALSVSPGVLLVEPLWALNARLCSGMLAERARLHRELPEAPMLARVAASTPRGGATTARTSATLCVRPHLLGLDGQRPNTLHGTVTGLQWRGDRPMGHRGAGAEMVAEVAELRDPSEPGARPTTFAHAADPADPYGSGGAAARPLRLR